MVSAEKNASAKEVEDGAVKVYEVGVVKEIQNTGKVPGIEGQTVSSLWKKKEHATSDCYFREATCHKCGKWGHSASESSLQW